MTQLFRTVLLMAVLVGVARAGAQADQRQKADDHKLLQGTWECVATFKEGKPVKTYVGVKAVIQGDKLTWHFPQKDGKVTIREARFKIDPAKNPKHFDWHYVESPDKLHVRLYTVDANTLRMADNLGKGGRPKSFQEAIWRFDCKRVK